MLELYYHHFDLSSLLIHLRINHRSTECIVMNYANKFASVCCGVHHLLAIKETNNDKHLWVTTTMTADSFTDSILVGNCCSDPMLVNFDQLTLSSSFFHRFHAANWFILITADNQRPYSCTKQTSKHNNEKIV